MPAEEKEIEEAKKEQIEFLFQTNLLKIIGENKVEKIECIKTELIKKEGELREVPINIEGSNFQLDFDYIIMAVGSKTEENIVNNLNLKLSKYGYVMINENYMTSKNNIFAGGDLAGIKAKVAWAARSGREAAKAIDKYLEENNKKIKP